MGGGRGGPAPVAVPAGFTNELTAEQTAIRNLGRESKQRNEAVLAINQLDAIAQLQAGQGQTEGLIGSINKLGDVHSRVEAALTEDHYQLTEQLAGNEGTRFQQAIDRAGTRPENWPEAGPGATDQIVDTAAAAHEVDLTTVPDAVARGIETVMRLKAETEQHTIDAKHIEAQGVILDEQKENRTIGKNRLKRLGYYIMHLAPGVGLGVLAGVLAGPLGIFYAAGIGLGTAGISELVGGTLLHYNEKFQSLAGESNAARGRIHEGLAKISKIRMDVASGNLSLVAGMAELQEELWANAGFTDAAGNRLTDVKNDPRIKGAFSRTGGVPKGIRDTVNAFAST